MNVELPLGLGGNPPTEMEVRLEAFAIAQIIMANGGNILGLVEKIEMSLILYAPIFPAMIGQAYLCRAG